MHDENVEATLEGPVAVAAIIVPAVLREACSVGENDALPDESVITLAVPIEVPGWAAQPDVAGTE
jgi:hypothetical protein